MLNVHIANLQNVIKIVLTTTRLQASDSHLIFNSYQHFTLFYGFKEMNSNLVGGLYIAKKFKHFLLTACTRLPRNTLKAMNVQ